MRRMSIIIEQATNNDETIYTANAHVLDYRNKRGTLQDVSRLLIKHDHCTCTIVPASAAAAAAAHDASTQ